MTKRFTDDDDDERRREKEKQTSRRNTERERFDENEKILCFTPAFHVSIERLYVEYSHEKHGEREWFVDHSDQYRANPQAGMLLLFDVLIVPSGLQTREKNQSFFLKTKSSRQAYNPQTKKEKMVRINRTNTTKGGSKWTTD